ncbi:MGMT family protein (plasmid) [Arthrobacter sp. TMP15]|uniref:MGMT family protein n=1 Tax=Arthrobacter sp. TMP15 TaxID=3140789 RepID=UPI0031BB7F59
MRINTAVVEEVRAVVAAICVGCVVTYGEIGQAVGIGPRQAGRAVSLLEDNVSWWRVVYADGTLVTCHAGQARALLEAEDVPFYNDRVDMTKMRLSYPD